jgi:hypothetical protein
MFVKITISLSIWKNSQRLQIYQEPTTKEQENKTSLMTLVFNVDLQICRDSTGSVLGHVGYAYIHLSKNLRQIPSNSNA